MNVGPLEDTEWKGECKRWHFILQNYILGTN